MRLKSQLSPILGVAAVLVLAAASPPAGDVRSPARVERTGWVSGWHVAKDGTVSIEITGKRDEETFATWFATPASATTNTRFEHLVLEVVLRFDEALRAPDQPGPLVITATGESVSSARGRSIADALTLRALSRGAQEQERVR